MIGWAPGDETRAHSLGIKLERLECPDCRCSLPYGVHATDCRFNGLPILQEPKRWNAPAPDEDWPIHLLAELRQAREEMRRLRLRASTALVVVGLVAAAGWILVAVR